MSTLILPNASFDGMLGQLLEQQRRDTGLWFREEIDSLVDPMLDHLFGQLKCKLSTALGRGVTGKSAKVAAGTSRDQPLITPIISSVYIPPTRASSSTGSSPGRQSSNRLRSSNKKTNNSQLTPAELVKCEIRSADEGSEMEEQQAMSSLGWLPTINELSNQNDELESDMNECDCEDCITGGICQIMKGDDDNDIEWIEDNEIDLNSNNNGDKSIYQPKRTKRQKSADEAVGQAANAEPLILIHKQLQCFQSSCGQVFDDKDRLENHMKLAHGIEKNRCYLKNCLQSFNSNHTLGDHIKSAHPNLTEWNCALCPKQYRSYHSLTMHNINYHQLGHFECAFPQCGFIGQSRGAVKSHYNTRHRLFACSVQGCNFQSKSSTGLKGHERTHQGIAPYRCKWSGCVFTTTTRAKAIEHIKRVHLAKNNSTQANGANPDTYLEVMHSLL